MRNRSDQLQLDHGELSEAIMPDQEGGRRSTDSFVGPGYVKNSSNERNYANTGHMHGTD